MLLREEGYRRIPGFLASHEVEQWRELLRRHEVLFRSVGSKGGLGLGFALLDGARVEERLPRFFEQVTERLQRAAQEALEMPLKPLRDRRRSLRIQRYRSRSEGFRWHFDAAHVSALLTLDNSGDGATEVIPARWSRLLHPLFFPLYPVREIFSLFPCERVVCAPGDLLLLLGGSVMHRGANRGAEGERLVVLAAFDPVDAPPRPIRDWIARRVNY